MTADRYQQDTAELIAHRDSLQAQVDTMVKALEPFARVTKASVVIDGHCEGRWTFEADVPLPSFMDFRAAASARASALPKEGE